MLTVRTFLIPKKGEELEDCQDSIHPFPVANDDAEGCVFAVSDGTTTSFFSRAWAATLTRQFGENPDQAFSDWETWLRDAQGKWQAQLKERAEASDASFFTRNGFHAHKPAAATFAALALGESSANGRSWRAKVIGDSCIFFLREHGQPRVLNLETSVEFTSVVKTVESWAKDDPHVPIFHESSPPGVEPPIAEHDSVLIASDALSRWMLLRHERSHPVWETVLALNNESEFADLVTRARAEAEEPLENDDVALVVLKFGDPHPVYREQRFEPKPSQQSTPTSFAPLADVPTSVRKDSQTTTPSHFPTTSSPPSSNVPRRTPRRFKRLVTFFLLSALSLAGVVCLGISRNRALDQARASEIERQRLSEENEKVVARAGRLETELHAAHLERAATERHAEEDAKIRRQSQEQVKALENGQKGDRRKILELQEQLIVLKEQLVRPADPTTPGEPSSPAPK